MDNKLGHARGLNSIVFTKCKSAKIFLKVGLGGVNISGRYWRVGSISHWTLSWQNCRNLWQDGLRSREDGGGWVLIELRMSVFGSFIRLFCKTPDPNVSKLRIFFPCSRVLLHSDNGGFLVLSCWWRFRPSTGPRAFFWGTSAAPGYPTLLVLGNFIPGMGGTERSISEPCARYPVWLAEGWTNNFQEQTYLSKSLSYVCKKVALS